LSLDFIELDALYLEPNWQGVSDEVFRERVTNATKPNRWAVAGNYSRVRDTIWPRAEVIVWLDYSLWTIFWQLTRRTFKRWWTHELLWETNYENIWTHFKLWSEESLYNWLFTTYWRRKKEIPMQLALPQHAHLKIIRFTSPKETDEWFRSIR
jgi:hypothetical protein